VGAAVRAAENKGVCLADLDATDREQHLPELAGVDLASVLSVEACLERHDCLGGTAPAQVLTQARAWKERLQS
jgi:argininosuccinate lyase